jgi:predicted nucleic acid-binding protein
MTIQEVRAGIEAMPQGAKRHAIERWLVIDLMERFSERILPVDSAVADECGRLFVSAKKQGRLPALGDVLIAATVKVHGLTLATLNRKHFERLGVKMVTF